jgi:aspartyl-tRNA(Asn)/glutamyl-tRNA(Gln) amidotransferase subunit A
MGHIEDKAELAIDRVLKLGEKATKIFTEFNPERVMQAASEAERRIEQAYHPLPLAGMLVSVKDLYDEAGLVTTAASKLLKNRPAATKDCEIITRIKNAGAVPFGRTSLSEFAYSGVGLNPHYGTPGNVFDESRIPGGSTSGGALTVALGLADFALGTDTGGSVRIPSAINGLVGFKPSRNAVPNSGIHPLAESFDTAGPLTHDLDTAITAFEVMSGQTRPADFPNTSGPLTFALPVNAFTNDLDETVQADFDAICARLRDAGHRLVETDFEFLRADALVNKILVSTEAYRIYQNDLEALETCGDPRVLSRIRFAETLGREDVANAYAKRKDLVARFATAMHGFDALIAPTLQMLAPTIAETRNDFDRLNAAMLRNTGLLNLADACAISLPVTGKDPQRKAPAALMLGAPLGHDWPLLSAARQVMADLTR